MKSPSAGGAVWAMRPEPVGGPSSLSPSGRPEPAVQLVGLLPMLRRPFPRILDRQSGHDDQHLAQAPLPLGGEQHPTHSRVDRQSGQLASDRAQSRMVAAAGL